MAATVSVSPRCSARQLRAGLLLMGVWLVAVVLGACGRGAPSNRSEAFALAETLAAGDTQLALHVAPSSTGLTPDARGGAV